MDTDTHRSKLNEITQAIIGCAFTVSNTLGCGFLEKVYENALALELRKAGLRAVQQHGVEVRCDGRVIGEFAADLLVEECIVVELKATSTLGEPHMAQCLNYLKATGLPLCLLLNFGRPKLEIRRIVC
jgi:GxxExxY protein